MWNNCKNNSKDCLDPNSFQPKHIKNVKENLKMSHFALDAIWIFSINVTDQWKPMHDTICISLNESYFQNVVIWILLRMYSFYLPSSKWELGKLLLHSILLSCQIKLLLIGNPAIYTTIYLIRKKIHLQFVIWSYTHANINGRILFKWVHFALMFVAKSLNSSIVSNSFSQAWFCDVMKFSKW